MMDSFERQLKDALRREEPPPGFAARVEDRASRHRQRSWWRALFGSPQIRWATVALLCFAVIGGALLRRERARRRSEGEAAKQQALLALQIAGAKLRLAQAMVQQINERSSGRDQ